MTSTYVKIPQERVGALIGLNGRIKEIIEKKLSVLLQINSETGGIQITLNPSAQDPVPLFRAKEVVTAIGRGFSPKRAFKLLEDDETTLEVIDLREIIGRSYSDLNRVKGRIIGKDGKTRGIIEEITNSEVSIYGHTISIIGDMDHAEVAREAILMLIRGRQHRTVYRFLHNKRRELKKKEMELWETTKKPTF